MKLGQLIKQLELCDKEKEVIFDFGGIAPNPECLGSYRGYYSDLAIGFDADSGYGDCTVEELLTALQEIVEKTVYGWKGGEFQMDLDTTVWIANPGRTSGTIISHVEEDFCVVLHTRKVD